MSAQTVYGPTSSSPGTATLGDGTPIGTGLYNGNPSTMIQDDIVVAGVAGDVVLDISVDVAIEHTWVGDLVIKLVAPNGDTLALMSRPDEAETLDDGSGCCGSNQEWGGLNAAATVTFADWGTTDAEDMGLFGTNNASEDICTAAAVSGASGVGDGLCDYFPNAGACNSVGSFAALAAAGSAAMNGTWSLLVGDAVGGDDGFLDAWSITITTASPSITVDKTVTLATDGDGNCANDAFPGVDPLGVSVGDSVCYWYTITNTGDVDFETLDLSDDQLGDALGLPFALAAGASIPLTFTSPVEILADVTNVVSVTYYDAEGAGDATGGDDAFVGIAPPANDLCADAEAIVCGQTVVANTTFATVDGTLAFCGTSLTTSPGMWYSFVGTGNDVTLTTCNPETQYDTKLGVFEGSCGALVCVGGNDDQAGGTVPECVVPETGSAFNRASTVTFTSGFGVTYYVYVTGFGGATGQFELTLSCAAPANDNVCDAAALVYGANGPYYATTATVEVGEPTPPGTSCNDQEGWCTISPEPLLDNTVWFSFVAPASGNVSIETSDYDTQLAVYEADACGDILTGGGTLLGANDDGGISLFSSLVTLPCLTPGVTYYVQVDGYTGAAGTLMVELTDNGGLPVSAVVSGGGLACDGATVDVQVDLTGTGPWDIVVDVDGFQINENGITTSPAVFATDQAGTYTVLSVTDANGCTAVGTGSAVVTVGTSPVAAFTSAQTAGTLDVAFTDGSTGSAPLTHAWDFGDGNTSATVSPTHTYAAPGSYTVCLIVSNACDPDGDTTCATITVVPVNDLCADALPIACGGTVTGSTEFATATGASDCDTDGFGVWYTFTGDGSFVTLSLDNAGTDYDTYLGITETCGGTCVAFNDDGGTVQGLTSVIADFPTVSGQDYFVYISGFSTGVGNYELTMTCAAPVAQDDVCNAIALSTGANGPFTVSPATVEVGEPVPPAGSNGCESVDGWCAIGGEPFLDGTTWYSFVAPASGAININTDNSYDTQIAVYEAASCQDVLTGGATMVGANDDNPGTPVVAFSSDLDLCGLTPGATYFLQVDGYAGATGPLNILLTDLPAPVTADWSSSISGLDVDFTDASTATGTIVTWFWDFGDGNTSSDPSPSHSYASPGGTFTVCLTVTDADGCTSTLCNDVTVADIPTTIAEAVERGMEVYPNPSNGEFVVEISGVEADVQINVMDVTGRRVYTEGAVLNGNFRKTLSLDVANGSYLLQVATLEGLVTRKIQIH